MMMFRNHVTQQLLQLASSTQLITKNDVLAVAECHRFVSAMVMSPA